MSDLDTSPILSTQLDMDITAQLIEQLLSKAHPLLVESIYLAAVPLQYSLGLLTALRASDDGRDERIAQRLLKISFISQIDQTDPGAPTRYTVQAVERQILLRRMIDEDRDKFIAAHQRALAFYDANPNPDPDVQVNNRLYHMMVTDGERGIDLLADTFRSYINERRMAAAESLLAVAAEARPILELLRAPWLSTFDRWVIYLSARMAQYQSRWDESLQSLHTLMQRTDLKPELRAFAARAYGLALSNTDRYVEAIEQYQYALDAFTQMPDSDDEQGFTMIALGDAYAGLAVSARGVRDVVESSEPYQLRLFRTLFSLLTLLPLLIYLSFYFGLRAMLRPKTLLALSNQDWIIARLFGNSARWYRRADDKLEVLGEYNPDSLQAEEKLANLYLTMGDDALALPMLRKILANHAESLGEYRQARVHISLGRALLRDGQHVEALTILKQALPVIAAYEDAELQARAQGLLAEAELETGKQDEALEQYHQAIKLYQKLNDTVGATEIAQRLNELQYSELLGEQQRNLATTTAQQLYRWQYLVRFQHPALEIFRRVSLIILALFILLAFMNTIRIGNFSSVEPGIVFEASPPLEVSSGLGQLLTLDVAPSFQTVVAPNFEPEVPLLLIVQLFVAYSLAYIVLGLFIIVRTQLSTVQAAQAQAVHMDLKEISTGLGDARRVIKWKDVTHVIIGNRRLLGQIETGNSAIVVASPTQQITIGGNTAWYESVRQKVRELMSKNAHTTDLSYNLLGGKMGYLYAAGLLVIIALIGLLGYSTQSIAITTFLTEAYFGIYSISTLYPYFYIALFIPPLWWLALRPTRIRMLLNPRSPIAWGLLASSAVLVLLRLFVFRRPWATPPDIYPMSGAILLLGYAGVLIWRASKPRPHDILPTDRENKIVHIYPLWLRWATAAGTVVLIALAGSILMQEIRGYDSNVFGNFLRTEIWLIQTGQSDQGLTDIEVDALIITVVGAAKVAYDDILAINANNLDALNNRGAVLTQLGDYEAAIADYTRAIEIVPANPPPIFFANRAVAYQGWSVELAFENRQSEADQKFNLAIEDFGKAIEVASNDPNYYLWRGTAFHALGELDTALADYDRALERGRDSDVFPDILTARGWALFQQADALAAEAAAATAAREDQVAAEKAAAAAEKYQAALDDFRQVAELTPASSDAWLAIGYVHYARGEYRDAVGAWGEAVALDPENPVALLSQSDGLRKQATNPFYCSDDDASAEQRASSIMGLQAAIADIDKALVLEPENDFAYRTRAQMQFLLGSCGEPEFVFHEQLELAIESYNQAISYAPNEDLYWLFKARLEVSLATEIFKRGAADEQEALDVLDQAAHDVRQALDLNPEDGANQVWYDFIINSGNGYLYLKRADLHYDNDNFEFALGDYRFAADLIPVESGDATQAALSLGRTALRLGQWDDANELYADGIEDALAGNHTSQLKTAIEELTELAEDIPELRLQSEQILRELQDARDQLS